MNPKATSPRTLSIKEKIQSAEKLYAEFGAALRGDRTIAELLGLLKRRIESSRQVMHELDVVSACRTCEEEEGGSCCGRGIEDRYDAILLLINLLVGKRFPPSRRDAKSCFFLGESGCLLDARHVLCVNYICSRLQRSMPRDALIFLQEVNGEELDTAFLLHEAIKRFIRMHS